MKKFLLATLVATGVIVPMAAQDIQFQTADGENITGTTYIFEGQEMYPQGKNNTIVSIDPNIYLVSDVDVVVNVQASSNISVRLCAGGQCEEGLNPLKQNVNLTGGQRLNLRFDYEETILNSEKDSYQAPAIETVLTAWLVDDPSSVVSVTVKMGDVGAGVETIVADDNSVIFNGSSLTYDVTGSSQLSMYSLSGKTVFNQTVNGNGTVGLEGLPKGIYLYRLTNKNGKAVKSAKIIIK